MKVSPKHYCEHCGRKKALMLNEWLCPVKNCDEWNFEDESETDEFLNPFAKIDLETTLPMPVEPDFWFLGKDGKK